jgi:protein CpxP
MKKISLLVVVAIALTATTYAQGGGFPRRTVAERVAAVSNKLDSAFKLEPAKLAMADSAFADSYRASDAKRQELMAGGTMPDRTTLMAEMKTISDARDEKLKGILTADQFKTWKEQVEPSMRPQRPPGGNGGGN